MAKTHLEKSGKMVLKVLEYLHNLPEPPIGESMIQVRVSDVAEELSLEFAVHPAKISRDTAKSILDAISISKMGYSLICRKGKGKQDEYWYKRTFTLEQISLLSSVISSSIFLNDSEIYELLEHVKSLTSEDNADELSRSEHFLRPRMLNAAALNNLRIIHEAINNKQALQFYNGDIDVTKHMYYDKPIRGKAKELKRITYTDDGPVEKIIKKSNPNYGKPIICFPYALAWDNSRCYLICGITDLNTVYSYTHENGANQEKNKVYLWNFRVDRMFELKIKPNEEYRTPLSTAYYEPDTAPEQNTPISQLFQAEQYMHSVFKMFTSTEPPVPVTLRFRQFLTRVIVERFGFDVNIIPEDDDYAHVTVNVQISQQFYGWLAGFYPDVLKIVGPSEEVEKYLNHLKSIVDSYATEGSAQDKTS